MHDAFLEPLEAMWNATHLAGKAKAKLLLQQVSSHAFQRVPHTSKYIYIDMDRPSRILKDPVRSREVRNPRACAVQRA